MKTVGHTHLHLHECTDTHQDTWAKSSSGTLLMYFKQTGSCFAKTILVDEFEFCLIKKRESYIHEVAWWNFHVLKK